MSYHRAAASRNALLGAVAAMAACRGAPGSSPRSAAEQFLDKYYVELSPAEALPITRGAAEAQVREVMRLRAEAGRGGAAASAVRPRVYWERLGESDGGGGGRVLRYRLRIDSGGVAMAREVQVRVDRFGAEWRVASFAEGEASP